MRFKYSPEQLTFLKDGYLKMQVPELTAAFNLEYKTDKTKSAIKTALTSNGFTCGRKGGLKKGSYRLLTQKQAEYLKTAYEGVSVIDMTALFNEKFNTNKTVGQIRAFIKNHKITSGRNGQFKPGHESWNAGTKGQGICKPNSGSFKKGHDNGQSLPIGSERICTKDGYIMIKINETNPYTGAPTRYKAKHIVNWEKDHGPVPKGMIVTFIDGEKLNCEPDNLELITLAENLYRNRNGYKNLPDELKPTMTILAKVETQRFKLEREKNSHE